MTPLESKSIRDSRGINTYERGLLYATLLLITSNTSSSNSKQGADNPYYDAISLNLERGTSNTITNEEGDEKLEIIDPKIIIEAHIPYNRELGLKSGGNFFEQIEDFGNINPNPISISVEPELEPRHTIKDNPPWVNSLEKYLVWVATAIDFGIYYYEDYLRRATINFVENSKGLPFIKIDATLPYSYEIFLRNRNLLSAVISYPIKPIM